MDVWIARAKRRAKCRYCPDYIESGQVQVVCSQFRRKEIKGQPRQFVYKLYFHPQCWIDNGLAALEKKELQAVETRGRKRLVLSPEDARKRKLLLMRRAKVVQLLKAEMESPEPDYNRIIKYGSQIEEIKEEIEQYGGVPRSWL